LGSGNYKHGAIETLPHSNAYICGTQQIDPYLLSPTTYNSWTTLTDATNQVYFPGYGLAIVGNPNSRNIPTLYNSSFLKAFRSKIYFMDYNVNRRIGRNSYLNASIILDGNFTSQSFYELKDHAKVYANNHVFISNTFTLSNYDANIYYNAPYNGSYINTFQTTNRDNFYYINFVDSFSTFVPHYFEIATWIFQDNVPIFLYNNDLNNFTQKFVNTINPNYVFNQATNTVNLSGMVFSNGYYNTLKNTPPLNDSYNLLNYVDPNNLPPYDYSGLYTLTSPIDNLSSYTLNYYSYGGQSIKPKN
jgi:hypothetical protein